MKLLLNISAYDLKKLNFKFRLPIKSSSKTNMMLIYGKNNNLLAFMEERIRFAVLRPSFPLNKQMQGYRFET